MYSYLLQVRDLLLVMSMHSIHLMLKSFSRPLVSAKLLDIMLMNGFRLLCELLLVVALEVFLLGGKALSFTLL